MTDGLKPNSGIRLADEQRVEWLRLIRSENVGPITFIELIKRFGTAANALEALPEIVARGRKKTSHITSRSQAEDELAKINRLGAETICLGEPGYPSALRVSDAPPPVLTVWGNLEILSRTAVAVVGSRNASLAGVKLTRKISADLGAEGYNVVSGLARGIDSAAHEAALKTGTVAVFAGGIERVYPPENKDLAAAIRENSGALISEMPFGWQPRAQDFPRRNRIVAGMALGLLVVEAAKRSGSLISARLANEMGRLVFAVPGSPLDPRSEGANHLIKQGAQLVTNATDILEAILPLQEASIQSSYSLDEDFDYDNDEPPSDTDRNRLLSALGHAPTDLNELLRFTGIGAPVLQMLLLELDLAEVIERHPGNRISLT